MFPCPVVYLDIIKMYVIYKYKHKNMQVVVKTRLIINKWSYIILNGCYGIICPCFSSHITRWDISACDFEPHVTSIKVDRRKFFCQIL